MPESEGPVQPLESKANAPAATTPPVPASPPAKGVKALVDEVTKEVIQGERVILKDDLGDNHYFQDWESVVKWAQSKADEA
jgi:hypothetical protein